ncbi:MAG TPA: FadD3 family acyl-CoA ligase [Nevskiaceae bacterium]|nr:FadD3 family acyl-CoA ligase [Nevskiaceae bacterium]
MNHTATTAFIAAVEQHGSRTAIVGEDGTRLSYAELDRVRVDGARALIAHGIGPGDRVAVWAQNCAEWVYAGLAIHSAGAVLVPVNTRMRGQEAGYVLEKSGAKILFCAGSFLGQHYPTLLGAHAPASLQKIVVLRDAQAGDFTWQDFLKSASEVSPAVVHRRAGEISPDSTMDILFTSGTTGQPKGVITTHRQNLRVVDEWCRRMRLVPEDQYLIVNPFFHVFGYKVGWLGGLLVGCTIYPHAIFDTRAVMARIQQHRISVLPGPPTLFISLLNDPERAQYDLTSLRSTITGAASVPPSLVERMRTELTFKVLITGYGLTESCGIVALCYPEDDAQTVALNCGKPIPGTEVICAGEDGKEVPRGQAGEVWVRGYNVMQGYLDNEEATREAIDADGWLHTGDIAVMDERGYLRITDRLKDMYIAGGFNCYPAEIERMIAAHPAVAQVAIIGVPDERLGEVGKAFVVPKPNQTLEPAALIAWCKNEMANYKIPRYVDVVAALPLNPSGKVMKFQLRAQS